MAQLNIKLKPEQLEALRRYAARGRTPVAWLIKDYVEYLLAGGKPMHPVAYEDLSPDQMATLVEKGGTFDWLKNEPDLYSLDDGEPV